MYPHEKVYVEACKRQGLTAREAFTKELCDPEALEYRVNIAIRALSTPHAREIFSSYFLDENGIDDVAEIYNISAGTVRETIYKILDDLGNPYVVKYLHGQYDTMPTDPTPQNVAKVSIIDLLLPGKVYRPLFEAGCDTVGAIYANRYLLSRIPYLGDKNINSIWKKLHHFGLTSSSKPLSSTARLTAASFTEAVVIKILCYEDQLETRDVSDILSPLRQSGAEDLDDRLDKLLVEHLSEREIDILRERYGYLKHSQEQVASHLGVSRTRVEQIEQKIFDKLSLPSAQKYLCGQ